MTKPRVLISTDIGGTDADDNQSMIHLMMFTDRIDLEGLVSSPSFGEGAKEELLRMLDIFALDYPKLQRHCPQLLSPDELRALCAQGRRGLAPYKGWDCPTVGAHLIARQARRKVSRPLYVLVWGTLEDVAQALHDAPDIAPKLRVYFIGGPNKKWGANSYAYIASHFPDLWIVENNASYRGFITDNNRHDIYNALYYDHAIAGAGAMGSDFKNYYGGHVKMGDSPSLFYVMHGIADDPEGESWGGSFERVSTTPHRYINTCQAQASTMPCASPTCDKQTACMGYINAPQTAIDTVPCYAVVELRFVGPEREISPDTACFTVTIDKQQWDGYYIGSDIYAVRYVPKAPARLDYVTTSTIAELDGLRGTFVAGTTFQAYQGQPTYALPHADDYAVGSHWFTDRADPTLFEGQWQGAATTRRWQPTVLDDWKERWDWLREE